MAEPLLRLAGITRRFGATLALDGLSLDVRPGEFLALLGNAELRAKIARLPGYDPSHAGRIEAARGVFPAARARAARRG